MMALVSYITICSTLLEKGNFIVEDFLDAVHSWSGLALEVMGTYFTLVWHGRGQ